MRALDFFYAFGWKWSLLLAVLTVGYIVGGAELSMHLGWPDRYGMHCSGRHCFFRELAYSPALLSEGAFLDYLLFAWLWLLPALFVAAMIFGFWDARRRSRGLVYPSNKYTSE